MGSERTLDSVVATAQEAVDDAQIAREEMRWTDPPGSPHREDRIKERLDALREAMGPLRSIIGTLFWNPTPEAARRADELRGLSVDVQYQRKQLQKMRR